MPSLELRLSQFGPALEWLMKRGVSADRLSSLFATTAENIRVIVFRARHAEALEARVQVALDTQPTAALAARLGIRPQFDEVVTTRVSDRKIEWLSAEIDNTFHRYAGAYEFDLGVTALRQLIAQIGYAGNARRIALLAQLHQHMAWLLVHGGRCSSASNEAAISRDLWRVAYHGSVSKHDAREYASGFVQAALIGSNAFLMMRRPDDALGILDTAEHAAESIAAPIGSEMHRQRGVALFQAGDNERAASEFERAAATMERLGEAQTPAQVLMTGARHTNLVRDHDWDRAQKLIAISSASFGEQSLEFSMALHWSCACGLLIDSPAATRQAIELLAAAPPPPSQFGHQATIRKLLAITRDLGFDHRLRAMWVRRALYENAARTR